MLNTHRSKLEPLHGLGDSGLALDDPPERRFLSVQRQPRHPGYSQLPLQIAADYDRQALSQDDEAEILSRLGH